MYLFHSIHTHAHNKYQLIKEKTGYCYVAAVSVQDHFAKYFSLILTVLVGQMTLLFGWGLFLVFWDISGVFRLIVVRIGATPVSDKVVLLKGQQVIQNLDAPLERTMKFVY